MRLPPYDPNSVDVQDQRPTQEEIDRQEKYQEFLDRYFTAMVIHQREQNGQHPDPRDWQDPYWRSRKTDQSDFNPAPHQDKITDEDGNPLPPQNTHLNPHDNPNILYPGMGQFKDHRWDDYLLNGFRQYLGISK